MVHGEQVISHFLLAIEDPFELDHNAVRTVAYPGVMTIKEEFKRALRKLGERESTAVCAVG